MTLRASYSLGRVRGGDGSVHQHAQNPNGIGNVFYVLFAKVLVTQRKLGSDLPMNHVRNANAARLGETLQPRRDVNAVPVNLLALDHHIAKVDADAELHPALLRQLRILDPERGLNRNGASNRLDHTGEFGQYAVTGRIDESAVVSFDQRVSNLPAGG